MLHPLIWSRLSGLMRIRDGSDKRTASMHKILYDDATFLSRVIAGDESWIYGYDPETKQQSFQRKSPNSPRPKKADRWRANSSACSSFSLISRGLFTRNSSWQAKLTIPHTIVTFYSNCVKIWEPFAPPPPPELRRKRTDYCITTTHSLTLPFSPRNFWPDTTWLSSSTHPTFLFPQLKIKLKGRHFNTIEVIEAESQAVLNTLTKHDVH
jgi:hypothetical protein